MMTALQPRWDSAQRRWRETDRNHAEAISSTDASDLGLVRRAQNGERGAFDLLVIKYRQKVVNLTMRYTHNLADAQDASQEAFMKAYRGLQRFRGDCAFYTWLYRIAINSAKDVTIARMQERAVIAWGISCIEEESKFPMHLLEMETPEELTLAEDVHDAVNAALEALPAEFRGAIILREVDGLSYRQIAATMATSIGTVRSRIFRARDMIDRKLRELVDGGLGRKTGH